MDLLVSSISTFLAFGIGRLSVVNSPVLYPDAHPMRIERGAYDAFAKIAFTTSICSSIPLNFLKLCHGLNRTMKILIKS